MIHDPEHFATIPKKTAIFLLSGPAGWLEVMTTWPEQQSPRAVGIICHPDPRQEGAMNNKVVTTIARAFDHLNCASVKFNFRGVGKSEGEYGHIQGELADLEAIIDWTQKVLPNIPLWLAGFSFGSYISALAAEKYQPETLLSIAPPVNHYDFSALTQIKSRWLVIQGDQDEVVPYKEVVSWAKMPPAPLQFILMPETSHFFHGKLIDLRQLIESTLSY